MKWYLRIFAVAAAVAGIIGCASSEGGAGENGADSPEIYALGAIGGRTAVPSGPLFSGGGEDIRLAVLAPAAQGAVPDYLPVYVQGMLNTIFKKYSPITLVDRQYLDTILAGQDFAAGGRLSEKDFVSIGNLTNAQYYLLGTIQKLSEEQYSLQLSVTDTGKGVRIAEFSQTGRLSDLAGTGALINSAAADLLAQLGVTLTDAGRQSLLAGDASAVRAETGLAKGITAQAEGAEVAALFEYTQSIAFDPSQIEALTRLNTLSASISGGTITQQILNDLQARDRWLEAFKEAAQFFTDHPPFEISFDPNLVQEGKTDYRKRTANLAMRIALDRSETGFTALNALLEGLEKTGKRREWGFNGWPLLDIQPKTAGTVVFGGKRRFSFKIDVALRNEQGKTLGKSSITLNTGALSFAAGDKRLARPGGSVGVLRFPKLKADDLTPTLTIVITGVNGITSKTLYTTGYMKIAPADLADRVPGLQQAPDAPGGQAGEGFVFVQGGTFMMGSPASEADRYDNEGPQHQVTVSSFYMGKYEVTQKEYQEIMGTNPSHFNGENLPVEQVSWYDAVAYCNARSEKEGLTPAYTISGSDVTWNRKANGYRLPTEAEWEYACRAGTTTRYNTGDSITQAQANYTEGHTVPVGSYAPNAWGLYDMHGNVYEWCWDWYESYSSAAQTDPMGAVSGAGRVWRGGSWSGGGQGLRSAFRGYGGPTIRSYNLGFRLVRSAP